MKGEKMKIEIENTDQEKEEFTIRIFDSDGKQKSTCNIKGRQETLKEINRLFLYIDKY